MDGGASSVDGVVTHPVYTSQAAPARLALKLYDAIVYRFNCPFVWRCPKSRLVALYDRHASARHLDIGVATGRLLHECRFPVPRPQITLMDLSPVALDVAGRRLARYTPRAHQANILEPWGLPEDSYESVAMCNVIHCLPGAMPEKAVVFEHAHNALVPGGVLFGATILGQGVEHNRLSRALLEHSNRRGVVSTEGDTLEDLRAGLERSFDSHDVQTQGAIALFSARKAA